MKHRTIASQIMTGRHLGLMLLTGLGVLLSGQEVMGQQSRGSTYSSEVSSVFAGTLPQQQPASTRMDLPGDFHKYYGQNTHAYVDAERKIAKLFMKMDLNYDGAIDLYDPADGGAFKATPPGCMVAANELTKVVIHLLPYRVDYEGDVVVSLEVAGINRGDPSGEFQSFDQERTSVGRIRVWREVERQHLLLDSSDPQHRYVEWFPKWRTYPYNLPNEVPRTVWVEGVAPSPHFLGDLRLLITIANRPAGANREEFLQRRSSLFKPFQAGFDHILLTVIKAPFKKEFVNNNAERVWWYPDSSGILRPEGQDGGDLRSGK